MNCAPCQAKPIQKNYQFSYVSIHRLRMIPQSTLLGHSIHHFLNSKIRTDKEIFNECVKPIQDQIRDCPELMKKLLGKSFDYFKHLKL